MPRIHRAIRGRAALLALAALAASGCAAVPRGDLDMARQQIRGLRAELAESKDATARLRTENREMAARAVDDGRRLAELEESNAHLEKSIAAYQEERDQYATALDQIKRAVVASGNAPRTAGLPKNQ